MRYYVVSMVVACGDLRRVEWLAVVADQQVCIAIALCLLNKNVWSNKKEIFVTTKIRIKHLLGVWSIWIVLCIEADCVVSPISI